MKTHPFKLNSISKKLLVPTLLLVTVLLGVLCTALILQVLGLVSIKKIVSVKM